MALSAIEAVVEFWKAAGPARWFAKDAAFDDALRERFLAEHEAAADGRLDDWADSADGSLALLILLDQFPRNCFRGTARMFATDERAKEIADRAIDRGFDTAVAPELRNFFYLPFMHAEDLGDQDRAVALSEEAGLDPKWAILHRDIIARFGRVPHRNEILGRHSTDEELAYLAGGGFAG